MSSEYKAQNYFDDDLDNEEYDDNDGGADDEDGDYSSSLLEGWGWAL